MRAPASIAALLLLAALPTTLSGCAPEGCLAGGEDCLVPSPCEELAFTCDGGTSEVYVLGAGDTFPTENDTLAAPGDIVLANEQVVAVIEALDHPHYIGTTGGSLLDFYSRGKANDSLRHIMPATGVLPGDGIAYTSVELLEEGDIKGVQLLGTLAGYPDVRVATRYEVRPCEPGVRVRTEIVNETVDVLSWFPTDAFYFGDRGNLPFVPGPGMGFTYPGFGLSTLLDGFRDVPYLATNAYAGDGGESASYAAVACSDEAMSGFHSVQISAVGQSPRIVQPRDYTVYERFFGLAPGSSVAGAVDLALELRSQLFDEPYTELSGTVIAPGGDIGEGVRASVLISEGTAATPTDDRIPRTHVRPAADGTWTVRVPTDRDYVVTAEAFGRPAGEVEVTVGSSPTEAPAITLDAAGEVTIDATIDGVADHVLVFVVPADDTTEAATDGEMFGHFGSCAPLLGNPHGPSPACNRVLVNGPTTIAVPPGVYDFYAVAGPFSTLAGVQGVTVDGGTGQSVALELEMLPELQPVGTLSGDFHVHGGASFDSSIPDADRVKAFLASRIEVVATTEHDTVWDYSAAAAELGATDRIALVSGTESTGHVLFPFRSDYGFPLVVGHWNFWPVTFDPTGPYRGASYDELAEPGALFTRQRDEGNFDADAGVIQLNHPVGGLQFGRNYGWISSTGMDLDEPPAEGSSEGQGLFLHTPDGADYSNADFDAQEVMNGTKNELLLAYRAFWHYLLQHGIVRAGTANSDSHTLTENVLGTPRTIVWTETTLADFDIATFNEDVREGHSFGTNGPVLDVYVTDFGGSTRPSVRPFTPSEDARLEIFVSAAPWVPIEEVRVLVNGAVVGTYTTEITNPTDPFGADGLDRLAVNVPLADILPASGDAWIVVEAGTALAENEDLDCDGVPDTGDTDGDGVIDAADVDTNADGVLDAADAETPPVADEEGCLDVSGPLAEPPEPERGTPAWLFRQVNPPHGYPMAFTNPLLIDQDADGAFKGELQ